MGMTLLGEVDVEFDMDETTGYRDYFLTWLVETDNRWIGPYSVIDCPGLAILGSAWTFGPYGEQNFEHDEYVFCQAYARVRPVVTHAPNYWWLVTQKFSNRPLDRLYERYTLPFAETPKVRGGFTKKTEEALKDRLGRLIRNSSWERFSGKQVEFDRSLPQVFITMNWSGLPESFLAQYIDTVNDRVLWGNDPRCVKFSDFTFERLIFGWSFFYAVTLEFDIDKRGFDKKLVNAGEKVAVQGYDPDNNKGPQFFQHYRSIPDREKSKVIINPLTGEPWIPNEQEDRILVDLDMVPTFNTDGSTESGLLPPEILVEKHDEVNLLELGIPAIL